MTPTYIEGDMWQAWDNKDEACDLFLITTNAYVNARGKLTMGRGIALEAKQRFPGIDKTWGTIISKMKKVGPHHPMYMIKYGVLVSRHWPVRKLGAFQTKYFWGANASLDLIAYSTERLLKFLDEQASKPLPNVNNPPIVHLNFPGIGEGKLKSRHVMGIIDDLPPNVHVWSHVDQLESEENG